MSKIKEEIHPSIQRVLDRRELDKPLQYLKPEPLKGKETLDYPKYERYNKVANGEKLFFKSDIASAVEWLKQNICSKYPSGYIDVYCKGQNLLDKIDEAFEDVMDK